MHETSRFNHEDGGREAEQLSAAARACELCRLELPQPPRPLFQVHPRARILVAGQAPGRQAHQRHTLFDDPSGDRLRAWMGIDRATFYDPERIAILPMGFCYPGPGASGDKAPTALCARTWRARFLEILPAIRLTLLLGGHAQRWHLPTGQPGVTRTVAAWRSHGACVPLPHPSPRNNAWLRRNPWFEATLVPEVRRMVAETLTTESGR